MFLVLIHDVNLQVALGEELLRAKDAPERHFAGVRSYVVLDVGGDGRGVLAQRALE